MIRPLRTGILLALVSAVLALSSTLILPWIVRFSMSVAGILSLLLALVLAISHRTHPVRIQRRLTRLNGRLLRAGSIVVGLTAGKIGLEFYGDALPMGFSAWLTILAIVHFSLAFWDRTAYRHESSRWRIRKVYGVVHLLLAVGLTGLHVLMLANAP